MGWMHDTLEFMQRDPIYRGLPSRRDLVRPRSTRSARTSSCRSRTTRSCTAKVRCSARCPATTSRSSPTCGCCSGTCSRHPGKKLLFAGGEFAQCDEWNYDTSLDWHLTQWLPHSGIQRLIGDCNRLYRDLPGAARARRDAATASSGFSYDDRRNTVVRLGALRRATAASHVGRRVQLSPACATTATASACRRRHVPRTAQHRRRRSTAAATRATSDRSQPMPVPMHGHAAVARAVAAAALAR